MTHLCVAIFVRDLAQAQRDIALAAEAGAEMIELRIDRLPHASMLPHLLRTASVPCIVTCRPVWEGGQCQLDESERLTLLSLAAHEAPAYIDIELKSAVLPLGQVIEDLPREHRPGLIVSAHDFDGRPDRLYSMIEQMSAGPGDISKIVWTARTIRDNLEAFEILQQRTRPTIALCMGEAGLISRILAKKFGGFLTFATLDGDAGTASGQIAISEMKRLYRWDAIGPRTKVYGVVASPVMHSMSPAIHNAAFDQIGHDGVYLPLLVAPGYESFKAFMETFLAFPALDLCGLSVTIPHKENALRYLQEKGVEIEPLAQTIGAVNTIIIGATGSLRGLNTDYSAILDSITAALSIAREDLAGRQVAVIGAGGTGRTAVAALAHYGASVTVYNRTVERAAALAQEFNGRKGLVRAAGMDKLTESDAEIYLNTTSIGMHPKVDQSPFDAHRPRLSSRALVFDAVYNPIKTKLLNQAEAAGALTVSGVEMFLRQAVAQFQAWTHQAAPAEVMRAVIERRLS